jgi:cytochrome P450
MISLVLLLISVVALANLLRHKLRVIKLAAQIPGHNGIPLVGILPAFLGAANEEIFQIMQNFTSWPADTRIAKLWLGPELIVVVNSPECIQTIFNSTTCLERPTFYDFIDLKKGLLFGTVDVWRSHRKILDQAFTVGKLKTFVPQFDVKVKSLVATLGRCVGDDIDIFSHISACFLDTFLRTTMEYECINSEFLAMHDR